MARPPTDLSSIRRAARELLAAEGPTAIGLRPVARRLGVTAPALYRYVRDHADLIDLLVADLYNELADELEYAAGEPPEASALERLARASQRFRRWALAHRQEFGLVFADPMRPGPVPASPADPNSRDRPIGELDAAKLGFIDVFARLFADIGERSPDVEFDSAEELAAGLRRPVLPSLAALPAGSVPTFLWCWSRLYGAVCIEVFGHLDWALEDAEPLFDQAMLEIADRLTPRR